MVSLDKQFAQHHKSKTLFSWERGLYIPFRLPSEKTANSNEFERKSWKRGKEGREKREK